MNANRILQLLLSAASHLEHACARTRAMLATAVARFQSLLTYGVAA